MNAGGVRQQYRPKSYLGVFAYGILVIIAVVAFVSAMILWYSVTWPWYLWKGMYRAAHPR